MNEIDILLDTLQDEIAIGKVIVKMPDGEDSYSVSSVRRDEHGRIVIEVG